MRDQSKDDREDDIRRIINGSVYQFLHAFVEVAHRERLRPGRSRLEADNWSWLARELTVLEARVARLEMGRYVLRGPVRAIMPAGGSRMTTVCIGWIRSHAPIVLADDGRASGEVSYGMCDGCKTEMEAATPEDRKAHEEYMRYRRGETPDPRD